MYKFTLRLWAALIALSFLVSNANAQWAQLGNSPNGDFNNFIGCLTKDKNGNLYATGGRMNGNGKQYVAKWNGSSWSELGGTNNSMFNSSIVTIATDAGGNVYAAGNFTNGIGKQYVAKWNGSTWSELGGTNNSTFNNAITRLTTDVGGNVYAAGQFKNYNGNYYVAKWNGNNWSELGGTNNSMFNGSYGIQTLTTDAGGNVYAAGYFTNSNGKYYVAKWNGSGWSELGGINASTFNDAIVTLTTDAGGNVYAAGSFKNGNGICYVAKWNSSSWSELGGTNASKFIGGIYTLTIDAGGNVYAAGYHGDVFLWNGSIWSQLGGTFSGTIYTLTTDGGSNVYTAGTFVNSNGKCYVAKYGSTPTPVTLSSFTAQPTPPSLEGVRVAVNWQTTNETNTSHFNLQRSRNGKDDFTTISTLQAAGNSNYSNNYSYTDNAPLQGISYYRLQSIDKDGSSTYSKTVSVQFSIHHSLFSITPNPVKDVVNIQFTSPKAGKAMLQVVNSAGQIVKQQSLSLQIGNNKPGIRLAGLAKGSYTLTVQTEYAHWQGQLIKE